MSHGCYHEIILKGKVKNIMLPKKNDLDSCSGSDLIKVVERFDKKEQQYFDS